MISSSTHAELESLAFEDGKRLDTVKLKATCCFLNASDDHGYAPGEHGEIGALNTMSVQIVRPGETRYTAYFLVEKIFVFCQIDRSLAQTSKPGNM